MLNQIVFCLCLLPFVLSSNEKSSTNVPIQIAFHWHMHQPIYWPYESVVKTINASRFPFNVQQVFDDRAGPYTAFPIDAITAVRSAGPKLQHCGAQVSFSGSLQENLNNLAASDSRFSSWHTEWHNASAWTTALGNPALYLTAFGYHHPLMTLAFSDVIVEAQIELQMLALEANMGVTQRPGGLFPPESSFSPRMIPALVKAGIKWVIVDNIHFDRAHVNYPYVKSSNLYPPNPSDQRNNQTTNWVHLNGVWAPSNVSAPFGYRPHWVEYVDPSDGTVSRIIAVPSARYEGVEDGRGGFGAFQYESVMSQYLFANDNASRPMLVVLAHDGDNNGGGTDSYYHSNFNNFVQWSMGTSNFECTTIEDYLARFPPADTDVIHVEDGSWSGANNGDPQFLKWNGNFFNQSYDPQRNSWAVIVAGTHRLLAANASKPISNWKQVWLGPASSSASLTELAWHYGLCAFASDYWYWPFATGGIWDSDPARAFNLAVNYTDQVINASNATDSIPPSVFLPQRSHWNPGGYDWDTKPEPTDFDVWTLVYDINDLSSVTLMYRVTPNVSSPSKSNMLYKAASLSAWQSTPMFRVPLSGPLAPQTNPVPTYIADIFQASITGVTSSLVDYYVQAIDASGNIANTPIQHVYVGAGSNSPF